MTAYDHSAATVALATTWAAELVERDTAIDARRTVRPPDDTLDETQLPQIGLRGVEADLELRGTLGEGGMAVVEKAWQRSLGREVAIKRARDAQPRRRAVMVREARIAGGLEHPGIVPVHALGRDEDGEAIIVMKRVSGVSWRALLDDPDHGLWGEGDRLLRNLEILIQVCRAIELAHSRGWLHRDLKTENVMVGEFGEVYVLDWGIAVPTAIAERGEAPFAGTPVYLAPEMAAAGVLTERTDVFLLGGILHEVLTGEPLHQGETLEALVYAALVERERPYPADAPAELEAIARRATAYHAEDRFRDVASLRRALSTFVVHKDALEIAEHAAARLDAVERGEVDDARSELVEARSGFRQSLSVWAENPRAAAGLDRCLRALVERELADEAPAAAAAWAAQLEPPDRALEERIEARRQALELRSRELAALRGFAADRDVLRSASGRRGRALTFAVLVVALGLSSGAAHRAGLFALGYLELGVVFALSALVAVTIVLAGLRRENLAGRWIGVVMLVASVTPFPVMLATWRLGLPAESVLGLDAIVKAGGAIVLGIVVQRVFAWAALLNLLTAAALLAFPGTYPLEIAAAGIASALLLVAAQLRDVEPRIRAAETSAERSPP